MNAVEEALRIKESSGEGEVVLVSMGPERAMDALRKALAMGADRAVVVADDALAGSDLLPTSRVLAAALERESPDLILFGQQASDSDGAVLWAAVADRLRRPLISQAAELEVADGKARAKRQTEYGYDVLEAPLPAVVAVSDAINEPRYPSLKGIMGAKKKPQEVLSLADLGVDGEVGEGGSGTEVLALGDPPPRGESRRIEDDGERGAGDRRLPRGEEADLMATLVFLEHHEGELQKHSLGVLSKAASLGDDRVAAALVGSGVEQLAEQAGAYGAGTVYVFDSPELEAPLPQPRVDALERLVRDEGFDTVLFGATVLAADVAAGLAARLEAGLNWDLTDVAVEDGKLVGKRPALQDSVYVDVGWRSEPRLALFRTGSFDATETGGTAQVEKRDVELQDFSTQTRMVEQAHEETSGPTIEDADVIVAGGRGLGGPENFALVEELAKALGGAVAATRAVVDAGWYPYAAQVGQTGKTVTPKLYVAAGISGAIQHKVGMQGSRDDRRDQQGSERGHLRVLGPRRRRRPARDRPEAGRARPAAQGLVTRPSDFPPPFSASEVIAAPSDPPDERIEVGVLIVGAGPGRARVRDPPRAAARGAPGRGRAARRRAGRGAREGPRARRPPALGRGREPARAAAPLPRPRPDRGHALLRAGPGRERLLPDRLERDADPDAADDEEPRQLRRLAVAARALARRAGRGGRRDDPAGDRGDRGCSSPTAASAGCAPATGAAAATARPLPNFEPGSDLVGRVTVLCEGTQGHLTGAAIDHFGLQGENPQVWALGVKEVWKVDRPLRRVIHTMGWPLRGRAKYREFGGSFVYPMGDDMVTLGMVVGLDYRDVELSPHDLLQELKTHRLIRKILRGGERIGWGAKTIPEGGFLSLPSRLHAPGLLICGDGAGLVNVPALKGIHYAIESGRLAAEAAFAALGRGAGRRAPGRAPGLRRRAARELRLERPARGAEHAPGVRPRVLDRRRARERDDRQRRPVPAAATPAPSPTRSRSCSGRAAPATTPSRTASSPSTSSPRSS